MTTVAIHQPNYLPYLGYFEKIRDSDIFVFLDNVTYTKNRLINRNKIKTPDGRCWLTVPVVNKSILQTCIGDVKISNTVNWRKKHWNSIRYNYGRASSFKKYKSFFEDIYNTEWELLAELNEYLIEEICNFLGITNAFVKASTLDVEGAGTNLLVSICEALEADVYFSGGGAGDYMDCSEFKRKDIDVIIQKFEAPIYSQLHGEFILNLSVIDFLLNCEGEPKW